MHPALMPDGKVVFASLDDLEVWAAAWCKANRDQLAVRYSQVLQVNKPPREAHAAERAARYATTTTTGAQWTPERVAEFLTTIGARSRELAKCSATLGRSGMLATEFSKAIDSSVTGLGKRFSKLERDAETFDGNLPCPARLVGPGGEKRLEVDPTFVSAFKKLNE